MQATQKKCDGARGRRGDAGKEFIPSEREEASDQALIDLIALSFVADFAIDNLDRLGPEVLAAAEILERRLAARELKTAGAR